MYNKIIGLVMEYNYEKEFIDSFTYCDYSKYMDAIKNSKLLGFVRRSALAVLFPNGIIYTENYLLSRIRTLFNAFKYDNLFMMSNFSYAKEIVEELYVIANSCNLDDVRQSFFNLFNKKINYQKLLDDLTAIHVSLTRRTSYSDISTEACQVVDIATTALPSIIGREQNKQWVCGSSFNVKFYWRK
jgi:hypothetical protein